MKDKVCCVCGRPAMNFDIDTGNCYCFMCGPNAPQPRTGEETRSKTLRHEIIKNKDGSYSDRWI